MSENRDWEKRGLTALAGGGGGPHDPGIMEARMTALELSFARIEGKLDFLATKADVAAIEGKIATIDGRFGAIDGKLETLATKADVAAIAGNVAALTERVHAQGERLSTVESALKETVDMALGKTLGVAGGVTLFGGMIAIMTAAVLVLRYFKVF